MNNIAYIFPGQGSQSSGMLKDMAAAYPLVLETFAEASAVLGYDLWDLVQNGAEETLNQTEYTQPALLAASIALWRVANERQLEKPSVVAGHSLGEYSALVAAGVISFTDAIALVQKRGQFMQSAVPLGEGGMVAVLGLADEQVVEVCRQCSQVDNMVQAANFNAPGQVVIAGHNLALEKAIQALKEAGAKRAMPLAVSAPFHSEAMRPAADKMSLELAKVDFALPEIKVIQNVHAKEESEPELIRSNLVKQMYSAVLWTSSIQKLAADGIEKVVECGPGKVLSTLNRRIDKSLVSLPIYSAEMIESSFTELKS